MQKSQENNKVIYTLVIPKQYNLLDLTSEFYKTKEVISITILK